MSQLDQHLVCAFYYARCKRTDTALGEPVVPLDRNYQYESTQDVEAAYEEHRPGEL